MFPTGHPPGLATCLLRYQSCASEGSLVLQARSASHWLSLTGMLGCDMLRGVQQDGLGRRVERFLWALKWTDRRDMQRIW